MFLKEFIKLTRFEHAIMLAFAVLIAETIVLGSLPGLSSIIILSLLVPIFSEMGSFALNDYFDVETDKLNKAKNRPLVDGTITKEFALYFSISSLLASVIFSYFINQIVFIIVILFNLFAIIYNWKLKDLPLLGNIYIGLTMAVPFIFGNYVIATELSKLAIILALLGFVAGLAREIIKSVQDMEGDKKARKAKTLPIVIGKKPAIAIAILLYVLFIPLSAAPFVFGLKISILPAILIALADLLIVVICTRASKDQKFARNASLVSFLLGMSGLFLAILI